MEDVELPPSFVFVGREYVQRGGNERHRNRCARYDTYRIPKNHDLPDTIALHTKKTPILDPERTCRL